MFAATAPDEGRQLAMEYGFVDLNQLVARSPRLQLVERLAKRYRFLHWELEFADIFKTRGGFDLMLGNPPWLPVEWSEADVLGDADPMFVLKKLTARQTAERRADVIARLGILNDYLTAHEDAAGTTSYFGAEANYPLLHGVRTNLYKCFLPLVWMWTNNHGVSGVLHPEKVYDEPSGGHLRAALYSRLRRHYQFSNALFLFQEVHDRIRFSINIYGPPSSVIQFVHIANLFAPATIEACATHAGRGDVPGLKDSENNWCVAGHRDRALTIGPDELQLFADIYDDPGTPADQARLPALHAKSLSPALAKLRSARRLADIEVWDASFVLNETYAQKDGTIQRETRFPGSPESLVLTGPLFYVANPLYKTPRRVCTQNSHYDVIDLETIPDTYLPRTNFVPAVERHEFMSRIPKLAWAPQVPICAAPRIVVPNMVNPANERVLQPALVPAGVTHVHTVNSYAFGNICDLANVAAAWTSVICDFLMKLTGAGHFQPNMAKRFPVPERHLNELAVRVLRLNCLTNHYAELWAQGFHTEYCRDAWANVDARLLTASFEALSADWTRAVGLRTDYSRRQALVELDVLVAMAFGFTCEELKLIYRSQFSVMRFYESDTWYDRRGRIVFTNSKGLVGVGLPRTAKRGDPTPAWNDVKDMTSGTVSETIIDDTQPGGPRERTVVYEAPFDRCDRERDYEIAWAHFEKRFGKVRS